MMMMVVPTAQTSVLWRYTYRRYMYICTTYVCNNGFPCAATLVEWISKLIGLCTVSK